MKSYGIHWFRRDLRIAGNLGFKYNFAQNEGRVVGLFCFDKEFLARGDFSVNRFQFFLKSLQELKKELRQLGSDLLFLDVGPLETFPKLFKELSMGVGKPGLVTWNRDYEPFARKRDSAMKGILNTHSIETKEFRDHLLLEPHEVFRSRPEEGYKVYSPFAKKWMASFQQPKIGINRIANQQAGLRFLKKASENSIEKVASLSWKDLLPAGFGGETLKSYIEKNEKSVTVPIPSPSSKEIIQRLNTFESKIDSYGERRDFPIEHGTSQFSLYFKNGRLTVPQVVAYYKLQPYTKKVSGRDIFFSELIWREFYYHVLYRHPEVEKTSFLKHYKDIPWDNNKDWFEAWKDGRTGFPIVDAGMRELKTTGWMHNRVRMIVASFLTKDLLINWQWGEKHFMDQLLDGDLAPNNGGWQWAASTGCDPQPYFRIFNPWLQSKRFDQNGSYIKKYIPELADIPVKKLHEPILGHPSYPEPIVDHKVQRGLALKIYKEAHEASKR